MNYTTDQRRAIETFDRNLQIIACAGSGKTQVISARIVEMLRNGHGTKPHNILAFTFTEKAATELKDRIYHLCQEELGTDHGLGDMFIGTIHAFCLKLLQEPPLYRFLKYRVLNEIHQRLFIDRNSRRSGLCNTPFLNGGTLRRWLDSKLYQQVISILDESEVDETQVPSQIFECKRQYNALLEANHYLDYTTIMTHALDALRTNSELRHKISAQLRYLIVDEYQDINPLQEKLIRELHTLSGNICVVGDDDQTIYQWRGSDVENIITFQNRYNEVDTVSLNTNFRSSRAVVESARQFIERLTDRLPKAMESSEAQPFERGDVLALGFTDLQEEANWIAGKIQTLQGRPYRDKPDLESRGLTYSDMVILLRSVRRDARPIIQALDNAGIPYVVGGMDGLFDTPEIQAIRQVFFYLADFAPQGKRPTTEDELRNYLANAGFGLSDQQIEAGIAFLSERKNRLTDQMDAELYLQRLYLDFLAAIELNEESIDDINANGRSGEIVYYNLGKFSSVISDYEQINFHSAPNDLYRSFSSFLHHQAQDYYPEGWEESGFGRPDAVQIMTVHKAKGMQWPVVFVPCLRQNRFPSRRAGGRSVWHVIPETAITNADRYKGTPEDERRLFFVAVTRAEKYLFCSWAPDQSNQQQRRVSRFHRDLTDNEHVLTRDPIMPLLPRIHSHPRREDITLPLTFSELKYYFLCPYLFKLRFLYGFNAPIDQALGYGKSLHDALAEIHAESIRGKIPQINEVERLVEDHLGLPFANAAIRENLRNSAAAALKHYLTKHRSNLDKLEHVEKVIELKLSDGIVVNGRIDLIRRTDTNEVMIVDFKSDERAQVEDITQRQLHVYAIGYEQLTGTKADLIEIHNLDRGGAIRELIDQTLTQHTLRTIEAAGRALRANTLPRLNNWCNTCRSCDLSSICRSS